MLFTSSAHRSNGSRGDEARRNREARQVGGGATSANGGAEPLQPVLIMGRTQFEAYQRSEAAKTVTSLATTIPASSTVATAITATTTTTPTLSAVQSAPSSMFNILPSKLASSIPSQLKNHVHGAFDSPSSSILSTVCTTYSTEHNFNFAPYYDTMNPSLADHQSGHSRSLRDTNVVKLDRDVTGLGLQHPHVAEDLQGNNEVVHPTRSDAHRSYRSPAEYERLSGVPRGHVDLHGDSGGLWEEKKRKSGYVQNHRFFYDPIRRQIGTSHNSAVFLSQRPATVPSFVPPTAPVNGFTRNQAYVPRQQSINEGAEPVAHPRYSSTYGELGVDPATLPRSASLSHEHEKTGWRAHNSNGFTRSEVEAPVDGSGTNHTKLWKDVAYAARQERSEGVRSALQWKHKYDSTHVPIGTTPVSIAAVDAPSKPQSMLRWGSGNGKDSAQQVHELRTLQRVDPVECAYQLKGSPALLSTYALVHGSAATSEGPPATAHVAEEKDGREEPAHAAPSRYILHAASTSSIPGTQQWWKEARREAPCMESGGVARPYESSMMRQNAHRERVKQAIGAGGQTIQGPSESGFTQNSAPDVEMATRVFKGAYSGKASHHHPHQHKHAVPGYAVTTHEMYRSPIAHGLQSAQPPHVIEGLAQSAYSREHKDQLSPIDDGLFYLRTPGHVIVPTRRDADSRQPVVQRVMALSEPGSIPIVRGDVRAEALAREGKMCGTI